MHLYLHWGPAASCQPLIEGQGAVLSDWQSLGLRSRVRGASPSELARQGHVDSCTLLLLHLLLLLLLLQAPAAALQASTPPRAASSRAKSAQRAAPQQTNPSCSSTSRTAMWRLAGVSLLRTQSMGTSSALPYLSLMRWHL